MKKIAIFKHFHYPFIPSLNINYYHHHHYLTKLLVCFCVPSDNSAYMRDDGTYIVNDDAGDSCIMFYFKANVNIYYPDTKGDYLVRREG